MSDESLELGFEEALEQLEATVAELESGQLPLEQALSKFEVAIRLQKRCAELLAQAEAKIEELTETPDDEPDVEEAEE
jgi:exodeoxyribonuclease VII small subunit